MAKTNVTTSTSAHGSKGATNGGKATAEADRLARTSDAKRSKLKDFSVLPDGDYWFRVMKLNQGTAQTDGAPMAEIEMLVKSEHGDSWVTDRIKMVETMIWKLEQFFACIGQRKHGQKDYAMQWSAVVGTYGYVRLKTETISQGKYAGQKRNTVDRYLDPPVAEFVCQN